MTPAEEDRFQIRELVDRWAVWRDAGDWERFATLGRGTVHGVSVDVTCAGRSHDFPARHEGTWRIVRRQPICERDRLDVVVPGQPDPGILDQFPSGYQHLAYLQTAEGFQVKRGLPGLAGPATNELYAEGSHWLAGGDSSPA